MAQGRDSRGRFAGGSGSIGAATRKTSTGAHALRSARTVKAEVAGNKASTQRDARNANRLSKGPKWAKAMAATAKKDANVGKMKGKAMERERKSLLRRSSINR